ncbi:220_t:CDS:1, partial [Cetraspora pellucida]
HLVKKYTNENPLFPQYATTKRRNDYPFISFGKIHTSLNPTNNPWTEALENSLDELKGLENEYDYNIELSLDAHNKLIESRKDELAKDKKMFELLLNIVSSNIQNDSFYNVYRKLKQPLITETRACQEALIARMQQKTWSPP